LDKTLILGDCINILSSLPENSVDSIVTDPPYELGFMGKKWDNSGIAYNPVLWKECFRVLKSGGHLIAFGGTRTYHRMAVAIEDAGFEVRDMLEWIYSSGFPKSLNVGKAVDKLQGNEREVVGKQTNVAVNSGEGRYNWNNPNGELKKEIDITKGSSIWEGFGTALKPAHEPIILARKPLSEKTIVENVLKHGTGAIDIDGCRIPIDNQDHIMKYPYAEGKYKSKYEGGTSYKFSNVVSANTQGRFPANIIVSQRIDIAINDLINAKNILKEVLK